MDRIDRIEKQKGGDDFISVFIMSILSIPV